MMAYLLCSPYQISYLIDRKVSKMKIAFILPSLAKKDNPIVQNIVIFLAKQKELVSKMKLYLM